MMLLTFVRCICGLIAILSLAYSVYKFISEIYDINKREEPWHPMFTLIILGVRLFDFVLPGCIKKAAQKLAEFDNLRIYEGLREEVKNVVRQLVKFIFFIIVYISISYMGLWVLASDPMHVYILICTGAGLQFLAYTMIDDSDGGGGLFIGFVMPYILSRSSGYSFWEIVGVACIPASTHIILPFLQYLFESVRAIEELLWLARDDPERLLADDNIRLSTKLKCAVDVLVESREIVRSLNDLLSERDQEAKRKDDKIRELESASIRSDQRINDLIRDCDQKDESIRGLKFAVNDLKSTLSSRDQRIRDLDSKANKLVADMDLETVFRGEEKDKLMRELKATVEMLGDMTNVVLLQPAPLLSAVTVGSLACVELLIKAGAEVNVTAGGATPLHIAADKGSAEIIKCLLQAGANPNAPNRVGAKPIQLAAAKGNRTAVELLLPASSQISNVREWSVNGILEHMHSETEEGSFMAASTSREEH